MADRLDPVAVGIPEERRVIGRVVIAQAGWTVIAATRGDAGIPECVNLGSPLRLETPEASSGFEPFRIEM
jgi:hypothetical protein